MKKYMGNYTNEAAKALKGSERIICRVTDDGAIYVTNGFIAYKMNPPEYAAIVQPVTCCEAGNYTMQNGEKAADNGFDLVKLFNETVEQTANAPALERCPLTLQAGKAPAASYYNPAAGVASFYNAKFIAALTPSATLRAAGAISAAVAYVGGEPLALVLPIKPEPKAARAVKAYFAECDNDATAEADKLRAELAQAQNELSAVRGDLNRATNKIAELEAQQAAQINEQTTLFVPEFTVARYDTETGELFGHAPDYEALEAAKSPAVHADKPGEYSYCYEMEKAPTGCDFSASLSYYGKHYYLRPLRDDLPQLRGRGISYDEQRSTYTVTRRAYDKLKEQYRMSFETCLD